MRIQHNIMAMSAYRNYNTNTSAVAKNLEKLSSGYKINRAGDDAAGLAISEKMRAQITGLNAAQKNVKDGISLVKTAEGAMQEIQDMLNRMDYLATQSANGTYDDDVDRAALQKEVEQLKSEINRIADSANFNGIKLLDGSQDAGGRTTVTQGAFDVGGTNAGGTIGLPSVGQTLGTDTMLHKGATQGTPANEFSVELHNLKFTNAAGASMSIKIGDNEFTLKGNDGGEMDATAIAKAFAEGKFKNSDGTDMEEGKATINDVVFDVKAEGNKLVFSTKEEVDSIPATVEITDPNAADGANPPAGAATAAKAEIDVTFTGTPAWANGDTVEFETSGDGAGNNVWDMTATFDGTNWAVTGAPAGYTATFDGTKLTVTADDEGAKGLADADFGTVTITASEAAGNVTGATGTLAFTDGTDAAATAAATAPNLVQPTADTINETAGVTGTTNASAAFDLAGLDLDAPAKLTFTIAGKNYEVEVDQTDIDNKGTTAIDEVVAGKLATAMNADKITDTDAGDFTAVAAATAITLTSANQAPISAGGPTFGASFTVTAAAPDADPVDPADPAAKKSISGDYNASTTDISTKADPAGDRLASTVFTLTDDMVSEGSTLTIGNDKYTFTTDATKAGQKGYVVYKEGASLDEIAEKLTDAAAGNKVYTVGTNANPGQITITEVEGQTAFDLTTEEGIEKSLGFSKSTTSATTGKGLTLQIGDTSDSYNQLQVSVGDMHTKAMGIADLNIGNQDDAAAAIQKIRDAINYVSGVRGDLGATQNRLEHTANNLSVMAENIQDAESTIRDTDIAEEMMSYTKNNILVQSAQAMLAQANQVPQGVLQLLG